MHIRKVGVDEESYCVKLRHLREGPQETPRALYYRVKDMTEIWLKTATATKEEIMEKLYLEQ